MSTNYHTVTPYLIVNGADRLVDFMKTALDATVKMTMTNPDGKLGHTEMQLGDSIVMLAEARSEWPAMPTMLYVQVPDADASYAKAVAAGATGVRQVADQEYGERSGGVLDMCGNQWWFASPLKHK